MDRQVLDRKLLDHPTLNPLRDREDFRRLQRPPPSAAAGRRDRAKSGCPSLQRHETDPAIEGSLTLSLPCADWGQLNQRLAGVGPMTPKQLGMKHQTCPNGKGCDQIMHSGHARRSRTARAGAAGLRRIGDWALESHHAERNHRRRYEATIGRDLFGD